MMGFHQRFWSVYLECPVLGTVLTLMSFTASASDAEPSKIAIPPDFNAPAISEVFSNPDCDQNKTCDLVSFKVEHHEYGQNVGDEAYLFGTAMTARYRTKSIETLRDYAVVQFIRGCTFSQYLVHDIPTKGLTYSRDFFGKDVTFKHVRWAADNQRSDPMYGADSTRDDRHFFYRWNSVADSVNEETSNLLGEAAPPSPELYIGDDPMGGSISLQDDAGSEIGWTRNSTLHFQTCIFRTRDVPRDVGPEGVDRSLSLHCVNWTDSHVYNYQTKQFDSPSEIDPICM